MAAGIKTGGRQKGTPNKVTARVKEALEEAFVGIGGTESLTMWAMENQTEFYKLYSKLLPVQIAGDDESPLRIITKIELTAPSE